MLAIARSTAIEGLQEVEAFPIETLEHELELSLKALRRDRIDRFLVHEPDRFETLDAAVAERFDRLVNTGAIGAYGLGCNRAVSEPAGFGTVLQSGYLAPDARRDLGVERVFHGVLRHRAPGVSATARLVEVLAREPDARVLLSVSTPRQLPDLHAAIV